MSELVLIKENEEGTITTLILNRMDKKNAFNTDLLNAFKEAIQKVGLSNTRVVVITGQDNVFSAGTDLRTLVGGSGDSDLRKPANFRFHVNTNIQPILALIEKIEKPVIARINGFCFGLALELALACDFRFALDSATISMIETKIGLNPDLGGTIRLTRIVGIANAKDIVMTGRSFDGKEAYRLGVVNGVASNLNELDEMIKKYADELIDAAPLAVGLSKKLIDDLYGKDLAFGMEMETLVSSQLVQTKDFMAGAVAKLQKKKPIWKGK